MDRWMDGCARVQEGSEKSARNKGEETDDGKVERETGLDFGKRWQLAGGRALITRKERAQ